MPSTSATAPNAAGTGHAPPSLIPPCWVLQVAARAVRLTTRGYPGTWYRGERLPTTTVAAELAERQTLVNGGMLQRVTAVASASDLNTAATTAGNAERADILAADAAAGLTQPATANPRPSVTAGGVRFLLL